MSELKTVLFEYGGERFDWRGAKSRSNLRKHGVTFEEGGTIFGDESALLMSGLSTSTVRPDGFSLHGQGRIDCLRWFTLSPENVFESLERSAYDE